MGMRGAIAIVDGGTIWFSRGIEAVDRELWLFGPEEFVGRVAQSPHLDLSEEWPRNFIDGVEGGVFIDKQKRLLIFSGGEIASFTPDHQAVSLRLVEARWHDWDVRWLANTWSLVKEELGLIERPSGGYLAPDPGPHWMTRVGPNLGPSLLSMTRGGDHGVVNLERRLSEVVPRGAQKLADETPWKSTLALDKPCREGLHLNFDDRSLEYYAFKQWHVSGHELTSAFPAWTQTHHSVVGEFEQCVGAELTVARPSQEEILRSIGAWGIPELDDQAPQVLAGLVRELGYLDLASELSAVT